MHHHSSRFSRIGSLLIIVNACALRPAHAETPVAGDISGMTFVATGNPHIVGQDLLIPEGKRAVIGEGCIFLFKSYTGIIVHGDLSVEGTREHPVTFTSINDGEFTPAGKQLPNPFDWNGIFVSKESGTVSLKNFNLRFSVYGIKSDNTHVVIDNGMFRQNGQFHFTLNDKIQYVQDNIPFSFNAREPSAAPVAPRQETVPKDTDTAPAPPRQGATSDRSVFVNKGVPAIIAGTGLASGVVAIVFLKQWIDGEKVYKRTIEEARRNTLSDEGKVKSAVAISTGTVAIAAITAGTLLYFRNNPVKKRIAVAPFLLPGGSGATIVFRW